MHAVHTRSIVLRLLTLSAIAFSGGCEKADPPRPFSVFPFDGVLLFQGQPAHGATIIFHRVVDKEDGAPRLWSATVKDDGHFVPFQADGAIGLPPGEYVLTADWLNVENVDQFGGRYSSLEKPLSKVTIQETVNFIPPIDLK